MRARIANDGDGPLLVVATLREFVGAIPALRGDPMRAGEPAWDDALSIAQEPRYACLPRASAAPRRAQIGPVKTRRLAARNPAARPAKMA